MTHFKATRPDGTDFYSGTINYAAALGSDRLVQHPRPGQIEIKNAATYISVATAATDCTSFTWPARLFSVEPESMSWTPDKLGMPNKRATHAIRILAELPAWQLFGPRGEGCVSILDRFLTATYDEKFALNAARDSDWWDAWDRLMAVAGGGRAGRAGLDAAQGALYVRLYGWGGDGAAYGAALAVLYSGFPELALSDKDYAALTAPWRKVIGKAHPNDKLPAKRAARKASAK